MSAKHPLQEYLDRTGRTLVSVAQEAGCSRMTLHRLMRNEQNATIDLLTRVSAATGGQVPTSALLPPEGAAATAAE